jgi:hypothetical protein
VFYQHAKFELEKPYIWAYAKIKKKDRCWGFKILHCSLP